MRLLVILLAAATLTGQEPKVRKKRITPADIAAGAKTFRSHCSPCHGMNGEGGRGPNLANGRFYHGSSDADLLRNISDGIQGTEMPGLFYSPDRVVQVIAYIRSLRPPRGKPGGNFEEGAAIFRAKGCPQCHRIRGEGGRLGPDLSTIGEMRSAAFLRESIIDPNADVRQQFWMVRCRDRAGQTYEGFLLNEDTYSVQFLDFQERMRSLDKAGLEDYRVEKKSHMPSFRDSLTDGELGELVAYLSSLRSEGELE
jgi:putative heme-binding domain-containing protein